MTTNTQYNVIGRLSERYSQKPVVKALLKLVPGWGSADTLLEKRAAEIRTDRLKAFFDALGDGSISLTEEAIASNDFLHCYFKTLRAVLNTRRTEKIALFAKILKSATPADVRADDTEELLAILDDISLRDFYLLALLRRYELGNPYGGEREELWVAGHWKQFFVAAQSRWSLDERELEAYLKRLQRTGLYVEIPGATVDFHGSPGYTTPLLWKLLSRIQEDDDGRTTGTTVQEARDGPLVSEP